MKHLIVGATRPDLIKIAPVLNRFKSMKLLHTGQHKELADSVLKLFGLNPYKSLNLMQPNQTIEDFMARCIPVLSEEIKEANPEYVWVHGDTMSALCGAWAGFLNKIPVVHLEAGLRTHDPYQPFPEEQIRTLIDHLSNIHLCPTEKDLYNLEKEGLSGYVTGNTVVEALETIKYTIPNRRPVNEPYILATIHRRESLGEPMRNIFKQLKEAPLKVVFPCHPNPKIRAIADEVGLEYVEPMNYKDLLWYLKHCEIVVTDSGGIQEEAPSFKKYVIVARNVTERENPYSVLAGQNLEIENALKTKIPDNFENPFGDTKVSERIFNIFND